jgi:predicted GNAT family acetyltransferase
MNPSPFPKPSPLVVLHNAAESRFEITVDGFLAVADYRLEGPDVVFTHTFVPGELRGRGIAENLVRAGLAWVRAEKRAVVPACSYVAVFIQRHAEFQDLLAVR